MPSSAERAQHRRAARAVDAAGAPGPDLGGPAHQPVRRPARGRPAARRPDPGGRRRRGRGARPSCRVGARTAGGPRGRPAGARERAAKRLGRNRTRPRRLAGNGTGPALVAAVRAGAAALDAREAPVFSDIDHTVATMAVQIAEVLVGRHLEVGELPALRRRPAGPRPRPPSVRRHRPDPPGPTRRLPDLVGRRCPGARSGSSPTPRSRWAAASSRRATAPSTPRLGPALQRLREVLA